VFFLLEEEEHLRQRGGRSLGHIGGLAVATHARGGWSQQPMEDQVRSVAEMALRQAGMDATALGAAWGPAAPLLGRVPLGVATRMGLAEACNPLFEMAASLFASPPVPNTLLGSLSSRQGLTASVILDSLFQEVS